MFSDCSQLCMLLSQVQKRDSSHNRILENTAWEEIEQVGFRSCERIRCTGANMHQKIMIHGVATNPSILKWV